MAKTFDELIFLLSTDCLAADVLESSDKVELNSIKEIARHSVKTIMNGEKNYYLYADFSFHRQRSTQEVFFKMAREKNIPEATLKKLTEYIEILEGITDSLSTALHTISSIASHLYWLTTDEIDSTITNETLEIIAEIESIGLERKSHVYDWEDAWSETASEWDNYIKSLMDGIDDAPYLTFMKIKNFSSRLDFLNVWKAHLGEEKFLTIKNLIRAEGHLKLDEINPPAAAELDKILNTL